MARRGTVAAMDEGGASGRDKRLRGLHAAARMLPLLVLAYVAAHAYEQDAVRVGRDALLGRLAKSAHFALEIGLVIVPIAAYALLQRFRPRGDGPPGFAQVERLSGLLALVLLAVHLWQVWLPRRVARAPTAAYLGMLDATRTSAGAALVLLFVSAAMLHLGLAIVPALRALRFGARPAYALATLTCGALWLWWVDILSAYVGGGPLL